MHLITCAHYNEASEIINRFDLTSCQGPFPEQKLFKGAINSESVLILITDEGLFKAQVQLASFLGAHSQYSATPSKLKNTSIPTEPISLITNLGVAGALNNQFNRFDRVLVRTAYLQTPDGPQFKSTTSQLYPNPQYLSLINENEIKIHDVISTFQRVIETSDKSKISIFAPLVDREVWAIGTVADQFKIPWQSLKVISDLDSEKTQCSEIRNSPGEYAKVIYESFVILNQLRVKADDRLISDNSSLFDIMIKNPNFYFTTSMQLKLKKALKDLFQFDENSKDWLEAQLKVAKDKEVSAKERAQFLLQTIENKLYPELEKIKRDIAAWKSQLRMPSNVNLTGTHLELEGKLSLNASFRNQNELDNIKEVIEQIDLKTWARIHGEADCISDCEATREKT